MHRHLVEHAPQLDGVLDGQGFTLLDLLRQRNALACDLVFVFEVVLQELFELGQHRLKHTSPGVGISLDHLNDALDFALKRVANGLHSTVKPQHACAHAVDQTPRWVVHRGKKIGL